MFFIKAEQQAVLTADNAHRTLLARGGSLMSAMVEMRAGGEGNPHEHPHEQICYIAAGKVIFTVEGESRELSAGDSIYVPGGAHHGVRALTDAVLIDIFTPQREDFL